jgi:hypothetical protein
MSSIGTCYIWGLPDMCRDCKRAVAAGATEPPNPAQCWPRPLAAVEEAVEEVRRREARWAPRSSRRLDEPTIKLRSGKSYRPRWPRKDLPAEPTTPNPEVVNSLPPEPKVDEDGKSDPPKTPKTPKMIGGR